MAEINMVPLRSSNVAAAGYDDDSRTLHVEFNNGGLYAYSGVPHEVFIALTEAGSPGSYLARNIRNVYPAQKIGA